MNKEILEELIEKKMSTRQIAEEVGLAQSTVRYYLKKYDLKTNYSRYNKGGHGAEIRRRIADSGSAYACKFCGEKDPNKFMRIGDSKKSYSKCRKCSSQHAVERFRKYKIEAVKEKGGKCEVCGYSKCYGSLHFHHRNPEEKDPNCYKMSNWSYERRREELEKCQLLCANCHGELHWNKETN